MERITEIHGKLLEGCVWDGKKERLYFIDIDKFRIYRYEPKIKNLSFFQLHTYVGCIVLNKEGDLIAALQDGLYRVSAETGEYHKIMDSNLPDYLRYNDGKCDCLGNLWVGTMAINQEHEKAIHGGSLSCVSKNQIEEIYLGYTIPNGLDWNEKENLFFHTETYEKRIDVYKTDFQKKTIVKIGKLDFSQEKGCPDGMCLDSEGNLWTALWGGGEVVKVNPKEGNILKRICLPDKNVSCCTFGGEDLRDLYITTARDEQSKGGEVYVCKVEEQGKEPYRYECE